MSEHDAPDPLEAARAQLEDARNSLVSGLVELDDGAFYLGWHPVIEYFTVRKRAPHAPEHLPAFMASLEETPHVHAGGETAKAAMDGLIALYQQVAERLAEQA